MLSSSIILRYLPKLFLTSVDSVSREDVLRLAGVSPNNVVYT